MGHPSDIYALHRRKRPEHTLSGSQLQTIASVASASRRMATICDRKTPFRYTCRTEFTTRRASVDSDQTMRRRAWGSSSLRLELVADQAAYAHKGIDHALYPEPDEKFYSTWLYHRLAVLESIPLECRAAGTRVIDIGGGKGRLLVLLSRLGLVCSSVDLLYLDTEARTPHGEPYASLLVEHLQSSGVQAIGHDFYAEGLPVPSSSFNLALCTEVIEHLPNSPKPLLEEIRRVLRPGGWLLLTTPNFGSVNARVSAASAAWRGRSVREDIRSFYDMRGYSPGETYRGHNREYVVSEVRYMLDNAGFTDLRFTTVDYGRKGIAGNGVRSAFRELISRSLSRRMSNPHDYIIAVAKSP